MSMVISSVGDQATLGHIFHRSKQSSGSLPDRAAAATPGGAVAPALKPTLKKVSKYENKFAKLQEKAAKFAFANQLKAKDK